MNVWILIAIWFFGWAGWQGLRGAASRSWPSASGRILSSQAWWNPADRVRVRYEYHVSGATYQGRRIRFGYIDHTYRSVAREFVDAHPEGAEVTIYHDPSKPASSVLTPGVEMKDLLFAAVAGVAVLAFGLYRQF